MSDPINFASASTTEPGLNEAARSLVDQVRGNFGDEPIDLMLVFLSPHFARGAKTLSETFRSANDGLLWINEFGIWPSSEYRLIFDALRQSFNESRPLQAAPGHVFSAADMDILGAMLAVALYFSWGALLVRGDIELIARISHDDFVDFYGTTKALSIVGKLFVAQKYVSDEGWS